MPPIATKQTQRTTVKGMDKRGKKFTTANSMLDILDRVNQVEESRVDKKIQRQHEIKKLMNDKQERAAENKKKKSSRLEDIKNQLRNRYSLKDQGKPSKKKSKKVKKTPARTLSALNREWSAAFDDDNDDDGSHSSANVEDAGSADAKLAKKVTFVV